MGMGQGAEVRVLTTVALKAVLEELAPELASAGHRLAMSYGPSGTAMQKLRAGEPADVVVSTPDAIETLTAEGRLVAGTGRMLARSLIGVAVRAGAPHPDIGTVDSFKRALLGARSIAFSNPQTGAASGVHFAKLLERLGIRDEVFAKAKLGRGGPVAEFLASGEADLAIQQISEHKLVQGTEVVGPLPPELQSVTTLSAALASAGANPSGGRALLARLSAESTKPILARHGLEPAA